MPEILSDGDADGSFFGTSPTSTVLPTPAATPVQMVATPHLLPATPLPHMPPASSLLKILVNAKAHSGQHGHKPKQLALSRTAPPIRRTHSSADIVSKVSSQAPKQRSNNQGRSSAGRLDFVLQEDFTQSQYISAFTAHFGYWTHEDVGLFVCRAICGYDVVDGSRNQDCLLAHDSSSGKRCV